MGSEVPAIVLKFYVEERSGKSSALLGGLIAPARRWERFARKWEAVLARAPALPYWDTEAALAGRPPFDRLSRTQLKRRCVALAATIRELDPMLVAVTMSAADFDQHVRGGLLIPMQTDPVLAERRLQTLRLGKQPAPALHFGLLPFGERAVQRALERAGPTGRAQGLRLVLEEDAARDPGLVYELRRFARHRAAQAGREVLESIGRAPARGAGAESRALEAAGLVAWAARSIVDGQGLNRVTRALGAVEVVTAGPELAKEWTDAVNAYWATDGFAQERA